MCSRCDAADAQSAVSLTGQPGHSGGTAWGMGPGTGVPGAVVEAASRGCVAGTSCSLRGGGRWFQAVRRGPELFSSGGGGEGSKDFLWDPV